MTDTKDLVVTQEAENALIDANQFEQLQRVAKLFAASKLIPEPYQNNIPDCFIALHMAHKLKVDPMYLMQHSYVLRGKPAIDGQLASSLLTNSGRYKNGVEYRYEGKGDALTCYAYGIKASDGAKEEVGVSLDQAKKAGWYTRNQNWQLFPEQMLAYRAVMFLARRYCPHILGGMSDIEELKDIEPVVVSKAALLTDRLKGQPETPAITVSLPPTV